jgi:prepilin-type N-terminal cleavage/methylation domain-containing protein
MTANQKAVDTGFTLVELLVALIIVSILAALTLSGLATVRRRAKEDASRTTIRKIHEIIVPMYEEYLDKRLPAGVGTGSINQLIGNRRRLAYEMPDNWNDVGPSPGTVPAVFENGRTRAYAAYKGSPSPSYGSAECLYMICTLSGYEPEAMENFRPAEIGDADDDGKPEFHDSWGSPIEFIRWPTGFAGPVTLNQAADPFDPNSADTSLSSPPIGTFHYGTAPLIYSPGLDKEYGLVFAQQISGKSDAKVGNLDELTTTPMGHFASPRNGGESVDNITNHDLVTR